jgi:thioredoxin reductase (NADPH)
VLLEAEAVGGQAGTSTMIRNYLGFPRGISGDELAGLASEQATLFGESFVYSRVVDLRSGGGARELVLSDGTAITARAVVLATGVTYRRLDVPGTDRLIGAGVFYGAAATEAQALGGQPVFVVGAANSAGQAALHLARYAREVTLVVRGPSLAARMSDYLVREIERASNIAVRTQTEIVEATGGGRLERLTLHRTASATEEVVDAAGLFVLIGALPHTDWLPATLMRDEDGYIRTGRDLIDGEGNAPTHWPLRRAPLLYETSMPGVFAAGDVRHRSIKRVASAVGEGSVTVQQVHEHLAESSQTAPQRRARRRGIASA